MWKTGGSDAFEAQFHGQAEDDGENKREGGQAARAAQTLPNCLDEKDKHVGQQRKNEPVKDENTVRTSLDLKVQGTK